MIVGDTRSEELPGAVVVANVGETARLRDASVGEKVNVGNGRSDTKTTGDVATVSVDSLNVDAIIGTQTVAVVNP